MTVTPEDAGSDERQASFDARVPGFNALSGRDAVAAIRGFVYQVETTILRWLDLRDGELLELERGEDIDLIGRAAELAPRSGSVDGTVRILEQVKHHAAPLTLRSSAARATLARYHAHRVANPTLRILLRYTTTSKIGVERERADNREQPAIALWRALWAGNLAPSDEPAFLASVRRLLLGGDRPAGVAAAEWEAFQRFVESADATELRQFVQDVEWSTSSEHSPVLEASIHERLLVAGFASQPSDVEEIHSRLRSYVWATLSRNGIKRLNYDDLRREVARPTLGVRDRARLDGLDELVSRLEARMDATERKIAELRRVQNRSTSEINARLDALAHDAGIRAALSYVLEAPNMEEPPLVVRGSSRDGTTRRLSLAHGASNWWAIHGASGMGKSQLALLIARRLAERRIWLSFRDLTPFQAAAKLDAALVRLLGSDVSTPLVRTELHRVAADLGPRTCIVLDDLPRFGTSDELGTRILALASACAEHGVRLLSTSVYRLAVGIGQHLPQDDVAIIPAPRFTADEAGELLAAHGAPDTVLQSAIVTLAVSVTRGHPVLLQALARKLHQEGWPTTGTGAFLALLRRRPDEAVNEETLHRVLETVEDRDSRQLLARLTIAGGDFERDDVQALAAVEPPIAQPHSQLHRITGLWVQAEAAERYSLSPLVRDLGPIDLAADTIRRCHVALAERIVSRQTINPLQFLDAFGHFVQGGEVIRAAILLVHALRDYSRNPPAEPDRLLLSLWADTPVPDDVPPSLRMCLRATQIRARRHAGMDTESLRVDLDAVMSQAAEADTWAVCAAALILVSSDLSADGVRSSLRYLRVGLTTWPAADREYRIHGLSGPSSELGGLIWVAVQGIETPADLREWLDVVEALPSVLREAAIASPIAYDGAQQAANALLVREEQRPLEERAWRPILEALAEMEERADKLNLEMLWAAARSARIMVHGEYLRDMETAKAETQAALSRDVQPETRFLVTKTLGLLFVDARDLAAAEPWLLEAWANKPCAYTRQYVIVTLWAAVAVGRHDPAQAVDLTTEAVTWARERLEADDFTLVTAVGEAAIARSLVGDWTGAFPLWEEAGQRAFPSADTDVRAAASLVAIGYPIAYFADVARNGARNDGAGSALPIPDRGVILRARNWSHAPLGPRRLGEYALVLSNLAEEAGFDDSARAWALRAIQNSERAGDAGTVAIAALANGVDAMECGDEEMLLLRLMVGGAALHQRRSSRKPGDDGSSGGSSRQPTSEPFGLTQDIAGSGDDFAAMFGLVPIALRLSALAVEDPDKAATAAQRVATACRAVADKSGDPAAWHWAAKILERAYIERVPYRELIAMAHGPDSADDRLGSALRMLAYLAASLDHSMLPADALRGQLVVLAWLEPALAPHTKLYRATITRFLLSYWSAAVGGARFRFSAPRVVEETLASLAAAAARGSTRTLVRRLVECLGAALGVRPADQVGLWLARLRQEQR